MHKTQIISFIMLIEAQCIRVKSICYRFLVRSVPFLFGPDLPSSQQEDSAENL